MRISRYKVHACLLLTLFILAASVSFSVAQERKYQRKSISTTGSVLMKVQLDSKVLDIVTNRLKYHLEVPRFDYNQLSKESVEQFENEANKTDLSAEAISDVMNKTLLPGLQSVVSAAAAERAQGNLKEDELARAVVDKLKESGVKAEDVLKVINSAYLYIPVVTSYSEANDGKSLSSVIEGYVLWYRLKSDKDGNAQMVLIDGSQNTASGRGSGTLAQSYSLKRRTVSGEDYARILAVDAWAKNLAVEVKNLPDFKLSADIINIDGSTAEAKIGSKEGISLDEGFDVVEQFENEKGVVEVANLGFYRVAHVADNAADQGAVSRFENYLGHGIDRGAILLERPRMGIDLVIRPKFFSLNLSKSGITQQVNNYWGYAYQQEMLSEDATSGIGIDAVLSGNLAKITGVRQLFINLEGGIGLVNASFNSEFNMTKPIIFDIYLGLSKKIWFSRMNLEIGVAAGYTGLSTTQTLSYDEYTYSMNAIGGKLDVALNYLISPDLSFGANIGYKVTGSLSEYTYKDKAGTEWKGTLPNTDSHFSGVNFGFNLSYAIPSLPIDPFSFLSTGNIDY